MAFVYQFPEWAVTEDSIVYHNDVIRFANITYLKLGSESLHLLTPQRDYKLPYGEADQAQAQAANEYILKNLPASDSFTEAKNEAITRDLHRIEAAAKTKMYTQSQAPMFCEECGHKLEDDATFCTNCGCKIPESTAAAPAKETVLIETEYYSGKKYFTVVTIIALAVAFLMWLNIGELLPGLLIFVLFELVSGLLYLMLCNGQLTVTNKRIYGQDKFWGIRVDLPLDFVSAVAKMRLFKGISVSTPSGRITFFFIKNADLFHEVICDLLIERQAK